MPCLKSHGIVSGVNGLEQENLDSSAGRSEEFHSGVYDTRIVHHEQRTGRDEIRKPAENVMSHFAVGILQQFACSAIGERMACYAVVGQRIVEVLDSNVLDILKCHVTKFILQMQN